MKDKKVVAIAEKRFLEAIITFNANKYFETNEQEFLKKYVFYQKEYKFRCYNFYKVDEFRKKFYGKKDGN